MPRWPFTLGVVVLMLAGCASPAGSPPSDSTSAPATPIASGPAFDPTLWEEPDPPLAAKIQAAPAGEWTLRVTGAPGAVRGGARILVNELGLARAALGRAAPDGSFAVDVPGGEGGFVQVAELPEQLPPGPDITAQTTGVEHVHPSTYVRASHGAALGAAAGSRAVWATGTTPDAVGWRFAGTVVDAGAQVRVQGVLRVRSSADLPELGVQAFLSRAFDAQGEPLPDLGLFATSYLAATGLPLERMTRQTNPTRTPPQMCGWAREGPATLRCDIDLAIDAGGIPAGGYIVRLFLPAFGDQVGHAPDFIRPNGRQHDPVGDGAALAFLPRGLSQPPRLAALLLADTPSQAARGVQADQDRWGWSNGIATQPPLHVTPRTDATGQEIRYTLDPYLPQVLMTDREAPAPPFLTIEPRTGSWTVTITGPDGARTVRGPAPFVQLASRTATTRSFELLNNGGYNLNGVARLATLDKAFAHAFSKDGLHTIEVQGDVLDQDGNPFRLAGTFRVLVAEPLHLDLGMLPMTPLAVGQSVDRSVQVHPGVPAHIDFRFRAWTGPEARLTIDEWTREEASAFGWFHPHPGRPIVPDAPGEYRVDVFANYTDPGGLRWAASASTGGVIVGSADVLDVRGRRGIDFAFQDRDRFTRADLGVNAGGNHVNFPYRSGDVAWQTDDDAMNVLFSLRADGAARAFLEERKESVSKVFVASFPHVEQQGYREGTETVTPRFDDGQGPIYSTTATGRDPSFGDPIDRWGYVYAGVEKPGVRVRENVREDAFDRPYWRYDQDTYTLQPGMGPKGDEPNDYKFLFAGAIERSAALGVSRTGAYASFWIDVDDKDPRGSRIGSAFDPASTPLWTFNGRPVRAFYDVTGVRAGSLLESGDFADFGGYVVPLGPARVHLNITSPSGKVTALQGQANAWGFAHAASLGMMVEEAGVWKVAVHVHACPPAADAGWPCLDGGTNEGDSEFSFYVATKGAPRLGLAAPAFLPRGGMELGALAQGGHATAWMPGWLLDAREVPSGGAAVVYRPAAFAADLPNFDERGFADGPADQVTFTVLGRDGDAWRGGALEAWATRILG